LEKSLHTSSEMVVVPPVNSARRCAGTKFAPAGTLKTCPDLTPNLIESGLVYEPQASV
jgi:hypothetical protein